VAVGALSGLAESDNYVFVPDTDRWVEVRHDLTSSIGKLDTAGSFLPFPNWQDRPKASPEILNWRAEKNVYEFRSGRLIKGELDAKGYFIPEIGSKVIDFKDYHYRKDGPRIWNLPGRFEKRIKAS